MTKPLLETEIDGRQYFTDGHDFGLFADALPDLLAVLERYAEMDWEEDDELAQDCREALAKALGTK